MKKLKFDHFRNFPSIFCGLFARLVNKLAESLYFEYSEEPTNNECRSVVFIVGAPRSGSTLLYQVLSDAFDFGYISNVHAKLWGCPTLVENIFKVFEKRKPSNYQSVHGKENGWSSPNECPEFWYRFFKRKPIYAGLSDVESSKMKLMRRSLRSFSCACKRPIIFKNLACSLRLSPLASYVPEALFIVLKRNELDVGHSLLEGRMNVYGTYNKFWSIAPPGIEEILKMPPHEQVIEQTRGIYKKIQDDREMICKKRFFDVKYEDFCDDVSGTLLAVQKFFAANGHALSIKREVPAKFKRNKVVKIDNDVFKAMCSYALKSKKKEI